MKMRGFTMNTLRLRKILKRRSKERKKNEERKKSLIVQLSMLSFKPRRKYP
jgi:hypothetical protein